MWVLVAVDDDKISREKMIWKNRAGISSWSFFFHFWVQSESRTNYNRGFEFPEKWFPKWKCNAVIIGFPKEMEKLRKCDVDIRK